MPGVTKHVATIAAFLILHSVTVSMECPGFCECQSGALKCQNASLTSVPSDLSGEIVSIDLSFNSISILVKDSFVNMPRLDTVVVSDNSITSVYPEVFLILQDLRHLDMHNNNIDYIHPNTFRNNPSLSVLDLSYNKLARLQHVFNSTQELRILNLSSNVLTYEDLTFLLPITSLQILDLSKNTIETISEEIFEGMMDLKHLNVSGNPRLDDDCRLRTLWTFCSERNITCVTGDDQSFGMVDNLDCGTEEQPKDVSLTGEPDGFMTTSEYTTEGSVLEDVGSEPVDGMSDVEMEELNSTDTVFTQSTLTSDSDGTLIWIIVGSVGGVILMIGAVFLICRYRRRREEISGNLSPTNSFSYLNTDAPFTGSNRSPRRGNMSSNGSPGSGNMSSNRSPRSGNISSNSQCERTNLTGSNRSVSRCQDTSNILADIVRVPLADIVRVPSFKTDVAAPLNLPEEIRVQERDYII
jgi:hypothetical protein